jgi:NAD(P)-dependent dehydrogenase (short-subunit alcohol dehydrogenase family)
MPHTAIVTGGTRGLGRAIVTALKTHGYRVAATYHGNDDAARSFQIETGIPIFKWDVADFEACRAGTLEIVRELGPIGVLVNNAGITADATLKNMSPDMWWRVIHTNLGSVFNMCRNVIDDMRRNRFGRIINITSINGHKGQYGQSNYCASKAGHYRLFQSSCSRRSPQRHHRQLRRSRILRHRYGRSGAGSRAYEDSDRDPRSTPRPTRRCGTSRGIPCGPRSGFHY